MPKTETVAFDGVVEMVFAHRFTFSSNQEIHLADLTPKGLEAFPLKAGLPVSLEGERRPSEIKVTRIATPGQTPVIIEHKKPHHGPRHDYSDLRADEHRVLEAVKAAGWSVSGGLRPKPKHFELVASQDGGAPTTLHVDFSGAIYKQQPVDSVK